MLSIQDIKKKTRKLELLIRANESRQEELRTLVPEFQSSMKSAVEEFQRVEEAAEDMLKAAHFAGELPQENLCALDISRTFAFAFSCDFISDKYRIVAQELRQQIRDLEEALGELESRFLALKRREKALLKRSKKYRAILIRREECLEEIEVEERMSYQIAARNL